MLFLPFKYEHTFKGLCVQMPLSVEVSVFNNKEKNPLHKGMSEKSWDRVE